MTLQVLIRADSGARFGSGHVIRCLTVAAELRDRGVDVAFATRSDGELNHRIVDAGHRLIALGELPPDVERRPGLVWDASEQRSDALAMIDAVDSYDVLVVDQYGLDENWETIASPVARRTIVIDDLANRAHVADIVVDQNWYGPETGNRYAGLVKPDCTKLLGPRYALLQAEYRQLRADGDGRDWPPQRLVVSFGGTDPAGETEKVVEALSTAEFATIDLDVIVGTAPRATEHLRRLVTDRPGTELHVAMPSIATLLARSDLAIGASGAATWERLCLGVPAIVATTSPHQSGVTQALADAGITEWVGLTDSTDVDTYRSAIRRIRQGSRPVLPPIVDGFGSGRLAEMIAPTPAGEITVRRADACDAPTFLGADSESSGTGPGLLDGPSVWAAESDEFDALLVRSDIEVYVVEASAVPVGVALWSAADAVQVHVHEPLRRRNLTAVLAAAVVTQRNDDGRSGRSL